MKIRIIKFLIDKLTALMNYKIRYSFNSIKEMDNVQIDDSVCIAEHSYIEVESNAKLLKMCRGVVARRFCSFIVYPDAELIIREKVFFNNGCAINCLGSIEINENVMFGENVKLYDHNHLHRYEGATLIMERDDFKIGKIKIGKNCWIGSNVTILKNVEIGDNVIIGANCLIIKSIPSNSIVKHVENLIISNC